MGVPLVFGFLLLGVTGIGTGGLPVIISSTSFSSSNSPLSLRLWLRPWDGELIGEDPGFSLRVRLFEDIRMVRSFTPSLIVIT